MAAIYEDSSRRRVFAERAGRFGRLSGPETCQTDLLEWSPGIGIFLYHPVDISSLSAHISYIFQEALPQHSN